MGTTDFPSVDFTTVSYSYAITDATSWNSTFATFGPSSNYPILVNVTEDIIGNQYKTPVDKAKKAKEDYWKHINKGKPNFISKIKQY